MAYQDGFTYVEGPIKYVRSTVSSTATFRGRNIVTLSDDRTLIEAGSDTSLIFGIAGHDAAGSIYAGSCLVEIPTADTIYAVKIQTGVAASAVSAGQGYGIEKSGNYLRLDTDSQATPMLIIVPRQDGTTIDSADSSVFVHIAGDYLGVFSSHASTGPFAQN
jgi:hypothetical protein